MDSLESFFLDINVQSVIKLSPARPLLPLTCESIPANVHSSVKFAETDILK